MKTYLTARQLNNAKKREGAIGAIYNLDVKITLSSDADAEENDGRFTASGYAIVCGRREEYVVEWVFDAETYNKAEGRSDLDFSHPKGAYPQKRAY